MNTIHPTSRKTNFPLWLLLCGLLGGTLAVQAQTINGFKSATSSGNSKFSLTSQWSLGQIPTNGEVLVFGYGTAPGVGINSKAIANDLISFVTSSVPVSIVFSNVDQYRINVSGYTNKITLNSSGILCDASVIPTTSGSPGPGAVGSEEFYQYFELSANSSIVNNSTSVILHIRHDSSMATNGISSCIDNKGFTLTFDGPGTNSFYGPSVGSHDGGAIKGLGGVIKNGLGAVQFRATNTYSGPTVINAGQLADTTYSMGGGSYAVADNASLSVSVAAAGTSLKMSSLALTNTTGAANTNTLILSASTFGNPSVPIIYATNLTLNGTIYVTLNGSGLSGSASSPGIVPLIQYNTTTGSGTLATNLVPLGIKGYLTNDAVAKMWKFVVLDAPQLRWTGTNTAGVLNTWDIGLSTNWFDLSQLIPSTFYNGIGVRMDDSGSTGSVWLATNVAPYTLTVSNNTLPYSLSEPGSGYQINGTASIIKDGTGTLTLNMTNNNSGYTYIKNGLMVLNSINAIGSGSPVTNNATLDLSGNSQNLYGIYGSGVITNSSQNPLTLQLSGSGTDGGNWAGQIIEGSGSGSITLNKGGGFLTMSGQNSYSGGTHFINNGSTANRMIILGGNNVLGTGDFYWDGVGGALTADSSPRSLTNTIHFNISNPTLGNAGAGVLTLSGPLNLESNNDQNITCNSEVVFASPLISNPGGFGIKNGSGTLRLLNSANNWVQVATDPRIQDGSLIVDGGSLTFSTNGSGNLRIESVVPNGIASVLVTNGGVLTVSNYVRLGFTSSDSTATNRLTVQNGTLNAIEVLMGYTTTNNAGGGKRAELNLLTGSQVYLTKGISIQSSNCLADTEVYLDGTTINAPDNASSNFLEGMTNVWVRSGGVTFNGANTNSIHIRQNLLSGGGSGGLTWNGTNNGVNGDVPQACTLQLDGTNTYTGTTLINTGILGGIGTLAGPLVFASGTALYPGGGGNIGTFTVNNNVTFNSSSKCLMELNTTNSTTTNDMLVVSGTLTISGATLSVNNSGPALTNGNSFKLFSKPAVGFTSISLPALDSSLMWQTNLAVDGSIAVVTTNTVSASAPGTTHVGILSDHNISLTVTGAVGSVWSLHATNNVLRPRPWPTLQSGTVSSSPFTINDLTATNAATRFYYFSAP
jgi:autotransporter-associated beta strand protein